MILLYIFFLNKRSYNTNAEIIKKKIQTKKKVLHLETESKNEKIHMRRNQK